MIKIFWGFRWVGETSYHPENERQIPGTGNRQMTAPEAIVYDRLGTAVGTITPSGVLSLLEGHRLPMRIELVAHSNGSGRALADPPNVNARPRHPKWHHDGGSFVF